jgi:hypothetical protein
MKFQLGKLLATPGALKALESAGENPADFILRHVMGDWGELSGEDKRENEISLQQGFRLLSAYRLSTGQRMWIYNGG